MQMKLSLNEKEVSLVLQDDNKIIDKKQWTDENNLLEKFFPILEEMLVHNDLTIESIDEFILDTNLPEGYTTARIAQTIIKTLKFAHNS
jgi:tRNA A37 threonylcarbamoyladenosine modification protein TsaB